jgi:drug/metabolite transporter (DMT)-like permease
MSHRLLFGYQLAIGLADTVTGVLLILAPGLTLRLMRLQVAAGAGPLLGLVGAFVFAVGLCCLHGAWLAYRRSSPARLDMVWLLTGIVRGSVALLVLGSVLSGSLEPGWLPVGIFDGACALVQAIGLLRHWSADAVA